MSTPTYRYLLCDLLTDRLLTALPLKGVRFDRRISRPGSLTGAMDAPDVRSVQVAKILHAYAGRSALWVFRDGVLWWGGIPWTTTPGQGKRGPVNLQVQAATFDSYAHHRRLYADATYTSTDLGVMIPDLWRKIQADPRGNIGVEALDQPTGVVGTAKYLATDQDWVGDLVEQIGDGIDGPEHTIDVYADGGGVRHKRLRVGRRLGVSAPRHVFSRAAGAGGRLVEWSHTSDVVDGGTAFATRGDGIASETVYRTDLLAAGWPLLDYTADMAGTKDKGVLTSMAQALAVSNGGATPLSTYAVEVADTGWTPNSVGDSVRLRVADDWHDSTDTVVRPVGCEVTPPEGDQPETINLLLSEDD